MFFQCVVFRGRRMFLRTLVLWVLPTRGQTDQHWKCCSSCDMCHDATVSKHNEKTTKKWSDETCRACEAVRVYFASCVWLLLLRPVSPAGVPLVFCSLFLMFCESRRGACSWPARNRELCFRPLCPWGRDEDTSRQVCWHEGVETAMRSLKSFG